MFWILRRTGAATFFNSINNNCSSKSNVNNNNASGMLYTFIIFNAKYTLKKFLRTNNQIINYSLD